MQRTKQLHRALALILGLFIISHLAVHLTALAGQEVHLKWLDIVQAAYRNPVGETLLVLAILAQIFTGWKRLKFKRRSRHIWARLQVISGLYLIMFLVVHTGAALTTHHIFNIETDFFWAAGSLHYAPIKYVFAVYYFFAVVAIFTHFAAALHFGWRGKRSGLVNSLPVIGAVIGALIITAFSGALYEIIIPADVAGYYAKYFGLLGVKP